MALVYSAFSSQSYEHGILSSSDRKLDHSRQRRFVKIKLGGISTHSRRCHLLYFEDRPVRFAVDGDKKEDVRLYHNKFRSFSPILAPVHVSGIISRADAFRTHGDSGYDDFRDRATSNINLAHLVR